MRKILTDNETALDLYVLADNEKNKEAVTDFKIIIEATNVEIKNKVAVEPDLSLYSDV